MTITANHIRYLQRHEIDPAAWDDCIRLSPAGLIYARSFFLDAIAGGQWSGLVMGDYEAVMPLVWNKKYGFTYLYQPHFVPALGVFQKGTTPAPLEAFLSAIPPRFRFWDFDCNENNSLTPGSTVKHTLRQNSFLPLDRPGDDIRKGYKRLARRMLQKALEGRLIIEKDCTPDEIIQLFQKEYDRALPHITAEVYRLMTDATRIARTEDHLSTYLARQPDGQILAFYLLLRDDKFVYSVMGGSTGEGKEKGAFYLLTDAAIQDHCNTKRVFRFEGSDEPGIAFFNAQFGSYPIQYPHLVLNKLPFPINLLKSK
jgi:hypothetical protein